ncbi:MAG: ABC transporter ATP-binding protein [Bacilli bacterium]|nr:ABC transporter ATP-binding protein [Bacilli bacterium]
MNKVVLKNITKKYKDDVVIDNLTYRFGSNGLFMILGESGSGKTTLLDIIGGVDDDYIGDCLIDGISLSKQTEDERSLFRLTHIGYLRQKPELLELDSALDNVTLVSNSLGLKSKLIRRKAKDLLSSFGLKDKEKQAVNTLSGGERSRVALAAILMLDPDVIIADEPTGGLDKENAIFVFEKLKALSKKKLVIVVTHDKELAKKYADKTLTLKGRGIVEKDFENETNDNVSMIKTEEKKRKFSLANWFSHSNRILAKKKWRTLLSTSLLTFSLFSLGLSSYVREDLEDRLSECFTSITGKNMVIVQKRNANEPTFGRVIAAPLDRIQKLCDSYDDIDDYGLSYIADFESYFPQENNGYFVYRGQEALIPSLSIRNFNDFAWLNCFPDKTYYPERPTTMENSQIVLGIPYDVMANLCYRLGIVRDYAYLGDYLSQKPLELLIRMQNDSWTYTDEHLFSIVGVTQDTRPTIYHLNPRFNEYVLEEKMRFPTSDEPDYSLPWILQKVYFIEPSISKCEFISKHRSDNDLRDLVLESSSYLYDKTREEDNHVTDKNRLYVYLADKRPIDPYLIKYMEGDERIKGFSLFGEHIYSMYPESLAMGFSNPFFISTSRDDVEQVTESISRVKKDDAYGKVNTSDSVIEGSFLTPQNNALTFSSDMDELVEGRKPQVIEEVCISSKLAEKLDNPATIYASGMVSSSVDGEYLLREYRMAELKVVGVVKEDNDVIFGNEYWTIDFFRELLGMSSFLLEPTSAVFYLKNERYSESFVKYWSALYPTYKFIDPSTTIKDSLSTVMNYLSIVLGFASTLSLALGLVLFLTVTILTAMEQKNEGRALYYLGYPRSEITNSYITTSTIIILQSLLASLLGISVIEVVVDRTIKSAFSLSTPFIPSLKPHILTLFVSLLSLLAISIYLNNWIQKRKFRFEKR